MSPVADWEHVVSTACHLQDILPDAVLVGGTSAALYAGHRISLDAGHVLTDLRERFDTVLAQLESVAGWKTARDAPGVDSWQPRRHPDWYSATHPHGAA